jgi:hypothetical protein
VPSKVPAQDLVPDLGPEAGAGRDGRPELSSSDVLRRNPLPYLARRTICTRQGKEHSSEILRTRPQDQEIPR